MIELFLLAIYLEECEDAYIFLMSMTDDEFWSVYEIFM